MKNHPMRNSKFTIQNSPSRPLRAGLFGIGLDSYWPQFKGLKPRLEGFMRIVANRLARPGRGNRQPGPH